MTKNKPKQRLFSIDLNEVSLVDAGDNPGAHQLIRKRKEDGMSFFEKVGAWVGLSKSKTDSREAFAKRFGEIRTNLADSLTACKAMAEEDPEAASTAARAALANFADDAELLIQNSEGAHVEQASAVVNDLVAAAAKQDLAGESGDSLVEALENLRVFEVQENVTVNTEENDMALEATPEAVLAAIDAMDEGQRAEVAAKFAKAQEKADPVESVKAKADDAEKAAIEKMAQEKQDLEKRLAAIEAREKRAKVADRVKSTGIGFDNEKLTDAMAAIGEEQAAVIFEALSAAGAQSNLTAEVGTAQDDDGSNPVEARAKEIQREKGVRYSQAVNLAVKEAMAEKAKR